MQTFLPHTSFERSAQYLDRQRLGKQRVEGYQILRTLTGETSGWRRHPAVCQWEGYLGALADYTLAMCIEWRTRGYQDNTAPKVRALAARHLEHFPVASYDYPPWLLLPDEPLQRSHRAALLYKDPEYYRAWAWSELPALAYWWPTEHRADWDPSYKEV